MCIMGTMTSDDDGMGRNGGIGTEAGDKTGREKRWDGGPGLVDG